MADQVSDEERALIDAAIAAGKVTLIPRGVSGSDTEVQYDPIKGRLRYVDKDAAQERLRRTNWQVSKNYAKEKL